MQRKLAAIILAGIWLVFFPGVAMALSYVMMSDEEVLQQASLVVRAVVQEELVPKASRPDSDRTTNYRVSVHEVLKGALDSVELMVQIPGRPPGKPGWRVPGAPHMRAGEEILLFLTRDGDGDWQPVQMVFGAFFQRRIGGERIYLRSVDQHSEASVGKRHRLYAAPRRADAFENWLRGGSATRVDYLIHDLFQRKFLAAQNSGGEFNRWFEFDNGGAVAWRSLDTLQAGATYNQFDALRDALAAWNNAPGTRINLTYAGTVSLDNVPAEPDRVVLWEDPRDEIFGSWNPFSGGILAQAWFWSSSPVQEFNGNRFFRITRAYIIVQDGVGSVFSEDNGKNGAEVLTHEVGHTLGFLHPCDDGCSGAETDATMHTPAHFDGRGAGLGSDDIAGAQFLYFFSNSDLIFADDFE